MLITIQLEVLAWLLTQEGNWALAALFCHCILGESILAIWGRTIMMLFCTRGRCKLSTIACCDRLESILSKLDF